MFKIIYSNLYIQRKLLALACSTLTLNTTEFISISDFLFSFTTTSFELISQLSSKLSHTLINYYISVINIISVLQVGQTQFITFMCFGFPDYEKMIRAFLHGC